VRLEVEKLAWATPEATGLDHFAKAKWDSRRLPVGRGTRVPSHHFAGSKMGRTAGAPVRVQAREGLQQPHSSLCRIRLV
jgi:hypothetical protein